MPLEVRSIALSDITIDTGLQARARGTLGHVVDKYAEAQKAGAEFPPIDVFEEVNEGIGTSGGPILTQRYWLADGFHRTAAWKKNGMTHIHATIHKGGRRDAILFSVGSNWGHGLKRTNKDKRHAIEMLLMDPEWAGRSDKWILHTCGVQNSALVGRIRLIVGAPRPVNVLGRDGRVQNTSHNRFNGKKYGYKGFDDLAVLIKLAESGRVSLIQAANQLDKPPRVVLAMVEEASRRGTPVVLAPGIDERLEHQLRSQIRELAAARTRLLEDLRMQGTQLETLMGLRVVPPVGPIVARRTTDGGTRRQGVPVMILSDLHVEEKVTLSQTNGMNEYNLDLAEQVIDRCADAFEWFAADARWDMREAIVALLGDNFSGWIHAELVESNFLSPVQAVAWLLERFERFFRKLLARTKFEKIRVICKDGNHGRLTQKMRASTRTENSLEWLMYHELANRFRSEPRLQFIIEDSLYTYIDVYDQTLAFTHGDQFQYMGGVGGLLIPVRRGLNEIRKYRTGAGGRPIVFCMGHFHTRLDDGDIVVNGSGIGPTAWSISKSFKPERRAQHWFLIDSIHGKLAPTAPVWLPHTGEIPPYAGEEEESE